MSSRAAPLHAADPAAPPTGDSIANYRESTLEKVIRMAIVPFIVYCLSVTHIGLNIDTVSIIGMLFIYLYLSVKHKMNLRLAMKAAAEEAAAATAAAATGAAGAARDDRGRPTARSNDRAGSGATREKQD